MSLLRPSLFSRPHRLLDGLEHFLQSDFDRTAQVNPQNGPVPRNQRLHVAERLGLLQNRKPERLTRDRSVARVVRGELDEQTFVRPAFMKLSGRMQKSRPKTERRRLPEGIPQPHAEGLEQRFVRARGFDVGH